MHVNYKQDKFALRNIKKYAILTDQKIKIKLMIYDKKFKTATSSSTMTTHQQVSNYIEPT